MYKLVFSKFKDSKLAKINREIPNGLIINTRGIIREPLSFLGAMGARFYGKEDLISIKEIRGEKNIFIIEFSNQGLLLLAIFLAKIMILQKLISKIWKIKIFLKI